jgi:hypothetical protein
MMAKLERVSNEIKDDMPGNDFVTPLNIPFTGRSKQRGWQSTDNVFRRMFISFQLELK